MSQKRYITLRVMNRGLVDVPIWEKSKRARNWCATVSADPHAPGGLRRAFWNQARGQAAEIFKYVVPESLATYDVVEFGADKIAYSGNRCPNRWYGVVLALVGEKELYVAPCEDAVAAFTMSDHLRQTMLAKGPEVAEGVARAEVEASVGDEGTDEGGDDGDGEDEA